MSIYLISLLILLVIIVSILIKKSILNKKFYKNSITFTFILIFITIMLFIFYDSIVTNNIGYILLNVITITISILIGVFFFVSSNNKLEYEKFNNEILNSLNKESYYLLLDKNLKIKEISNLLAEAFDLKREEVINKKISDCLNGKIKIDKINDTDSDNQEFFNYLSLKIKEGKYDLKIDYFKEDDSYNSIYLIDTPIYVLDKYKSRMFFYKDNETNVIYKDNKEDQYLTYKIDSLLKNSQIGVSIIDLDKETMYINDYLVSNLGLFGNNIPLKLFYNNCNLNDVEVIKEKIRKSDFNQNTFEITYQYKKDNEVVFINEKATVLFKNGKKKEIISSIMISKNRDFMVVNNNTLDSLRGFEDFNVKLEQIAKDNNNYELVYLRLANIPEINDKYSRAVGSMVLAEYIRMLAKAFCDYENIFRISGLDFAFIITDITKMEFLRKTLFEKNMLRPKLTYGSININLVCYMGISFSNEAIRPKDIYLNAKNSMLKAVDSNKEFLFYKNYND